MGLAGIFKAFDADAVGARVTTASEMTVKRGLYAVCQPEAEDLASAAHTHLTEAEMESMTQPELRRYTDTQNQCPRQPKVGQHA